MTSLPPPALSSGALDWTRTSTSFRTQALNLPRIPIPPRGQTRTASIRRPFLGWQARVVGSVSCDVLRAVAPSVETDFYRYSVTTPHGTGPSPESRSDSPPVAVELIHSIQTT